MSTKKHLFFVFALLTMILVACKPETDVKHTVTYKDSQLKNLRYPYSPIREYGYSSGDQRRKGGP